MNQAACSITSLLTTSEERDFYDAFYRKALTHSERSLRSTRQAILSHLNNPSSPYFERRQLYLLALKKVFESSVKDINVLDYGCGTGDWGVMLASEGANVTLLDLSPVGVEVGRRRAKATGVSHKVNTIARDASDLSCFSDGQFDLVFASASLHHTIKYPNALKELLRVIKPGGRLVLAETFGNNMLLNFFRRMRWQLCNQPLEAGEGIIFSNKEVELLKENFSRIEVAPLNLLAMGKRLFRGKFESRSVRIICKALEKTDKFLLAVFPWLRRHCGEVVVVGYR